MPGIPFIRDFKFDYGTAMEVTPLIRRVVAHNPNPFTFKGTGTYIIGHGKVAIVDPGPDDQEHIDAVLRAVRGETVTHIFVTHTHIDHVPATPAMAKATGAKVYSYGPHPKPPAGVATEQEGDFSLRARHQAQRRRRGARRRLERRGGLYAGPYLQPPLLRREGRQGAAVRRSRHGLVDRGDLAARRQHGRLFRVVCASCCRARRRSTSRRTARRSAIRIRSSSPISSIAWAARRRSWRASRKGRRPFRRWSPRTTPTRRSICMPPPAARCWPTSSRW